MDKLRFGVIGCGGMGGAHIEYLNSADGACLAAVCDVDAEKAKKHSTKHNVPSFLNHKDLLASKTCDAVIVATPHYFHPPITREAFAAGLHVLCEKPIAVDVKEARITNELYQANYKHLKFGVMFQMRTTPVMRKVRELILGGDLGQLTRMTWLCTDWFRTWAYYASGGWRATWKGEGGGVLLNQCPHNLDQMQWLLGGKLPSRVTAVATIAKRHPIEVEDEVSAIMEYPDGMIGHFITTTGEAPGSNRLEFAGDQGKLVIENGKIRFFRTRRSVTETLQASKEMFINVETWDSEIPPMQGGEAHKTITQNFINAIRNDEELISPGVEGVKGLELGNAIMMAGLTGTPVDLPVNGDAYQAFMKEMTARYSGKKTLVERKAVPDMQASFR
jgi:predicted dehydrogenase